MWIQCKSCVWRMGGHAVVNVKVRVSVCVCVKRLVCGIVGVESMRVWVRRRGCVADSVQCVHNSKDRIRNTAVHDKTKCLHLQMSP